jgi:hypothetical protein
MELTYCSETLAHEIQTPGNHPKERIQQEVNNSYFQNRILFVKSVGL